MSSKAVAPRPVRREPSSAAPSTDALRKLDPRKLVRNPVIFVTEVVSAVVTYPVRPRSRHGTTAPLCSPARSPPGCGSRCCSPISPKPSPKGAARRRPTRCAARAPTRWPSGSSIPTTGDGRRREPSTRARPRSSATSCSSKRAISIPADGDVIEGIASVNEFGDHRRIRAGHPRVRRRPLGRDRRHDRALRLDQGAHHRGAGLDLPRPHDRAGRRRRAPEDAERTRAVDPAVGPDAHLPDRLS